ncbi:MAG: 3-deoxy-D-manno-octulosonic acid transferase [Azospirillaceae bacterium]|nr:3-deoxy-D-manno-octulosonic acid transferase [Azospirillaceae bacterium]
MLHLLYRALTTLGGPVILGWLRHRTAVGKEDRLRHGERLGIASHPRPSGIVVWFHAASVGESLSILTLAERLIERLPEAHVLITTGTVTSATLLAHRLPARTLHQFVPVDRPAYAARFLDHWRPDLVLWVESEIWPNLLWALARRHIPTALINARMSARSFSRWRRVPGFIRPLLGTFRLCLAQTEAEAERLRQLGALGVVCLGNLKYSAAPPPAEPRALATLAAALGGRPLWLFASTHPGEPEIAAAIHQQLEAQFPGLLTVIAPRHANAGDGIATMLANRGFRVGRRSLNGVPAADEQIHIADTMGEMGLWYRLAPVTCIGKTFTVEGGHNPIEPAQLGCAVIYGPHMTNFPEIAAELEASGAARRLASAEELGAMLATLLSDPAARERLVQAARAVARRHHAVIDDVIIALTPLLTEAGLVPVP